MNTVHTMRLLFSALMSTHYSILYGKCVLSMEKIGRKSASAGAHFINRLLLIAFVAAAKRESTAQIIETEQISFG